MQYIVTAGTVGVLCYTIGSGPGGLHIDKEVLHEALGIRRTGKLLRCCHRQARGGWALVQHLCLEGGTLGQEQTIIHRLVKVRCWLLPFPLQPWQRRTPSCRRLFGSLSCRLPGALVISVAGTLGSSLVDRLVF